MCVCWGSPDQDCPLIFKCWRNSASSWQPREAQPKYLGRLSLCLTLPAELLNDSILTLRCSELINPSCSASGSTSDALPRHCPVPNHENGGSDEEPDKSPFLETLLNHHNPPPVFMVQVLLVSPRQLPPWQPPAMEPNLFQGRCPSETLAQL